MDRFARAYEAGAKMGREGLPMLDSQRAELTGAVQQLDKIHPGLSHEMTSALTHDPKLRSVMKDLTGRERTGELIKGLERERTQLADPKVRADRVIARWLGLSAKREKLEGWQHDKARVPVEEEMRGLARELQRDPQMESILRNRKRELGIDQSLHGKSLGRELERQLDRGRDLGLEL